MKPLKRYTKWEDIASGKKFYVPTYKGKEILFQQFPIPIKVRFNNASDAQAYAFRNLRKKKAQEDRFKDQDYHKEVLVRYAAMVKKVLLTTYGATDEKESDP